MKIAFISDLHLTFRNQLPEGVNNIDNLKLVFKDIKLNNYDLIIIGGDISYKDPEEASNTFLLESLNNLSINFRVIGGNHDDADSLLKVFETQYEQYAEIKYGIWKLVFINAEEGYVMQDTLNKIRLAQLNSRVIIFSHYPLIYSNVPYMDTNYSVNNLKFIEQELATMNDGLIVISGHYHIDKTIIRNGVSQFICPSLISQIDDREIKFKEETRNVGYRSISITSDGSFESRVIWINDEAI